MGDRVSQSGPSLRTLLSFLVLGSLALAACEPALVSFPADRDSRGDVEPLGLELPEGPGSVGSQGSLGAPGETTGFGDTIVRPDGTDPVPQLPVAESSGCSAVVSQMGWCATLKDHPGPGSAVTFVGLDDGQTCSPLEASVGSSVLSVSSLALQGTTMAWCDSGGVLHQVDMSTGAVQTTANPALFCGGLTSASGGFAVLPQALGRNITWYPRLSDMLGGDDGVTWPVRPVATRLAADSLVIYAAEYETDLVTRWLIDGTELESLVLDDWGEINGFDAAPQDRMVVLNDQRDLSIYDRITGALLESIELDGTFSGLVCFPEP